MRSGWPAKALARSRYAALLTAAGALALLPGTVAAQATCGGPPTDLSVVSRHVFLGTAEEWTYRTDQFPLRYITFDVDRVLAGGGGDLRAGAPVTIYSALTDGIDGFVVGERYLVGVQRTDAALQCDAVAWRIDEDKADLVVMSTYDGVPSRLARADTLEMAVALLVPDARYATYRLGRRSRVNRHRLIIGAGRRLHDWRRGVVPP